MPYRLRSPTRQGSFSGITFDAGGLIALDRNDRKVTALAQAIRNPVRQARLSRLIRLSSADLMALNGTDATAVGLLLTRTATADIVDAHVVVCARRAGQAVITSDAGDLRRIAPGLPLVVV